MSDVLADLTTAITDKTALSERLTEKTYLEVKRLRSIVDSKTLLVEELEEKIEKLETALKLKQYDLEKEMYRRVDAETKNDKLSKVLHPFVEAGKWIWRYHPHYTKQDEASVYIADLVKAYFTVKTM